MWMNTQPLIAIHVRRKIAVAVSRKLDEGVFSVQGMDRTFQDPERAY